MLNGLAAWFVGFDGNFGFDQIGDSYTDAGVSKFNFPMKDIQKER